MIKDHKPLVEIFKKDVANLLHRLQRILLCIQQYKIKILYSSGPQLFIAAMLSRHDQTINKDEEIPRMNNINVIGTCPDILQCITAEKYGF